MSTWESGTIDANGIQIFYTRTGGAKPPLVLAHGLSDDGLCWTAVARALEPSYDLIMVDARGHGRSAAPETGYGPADLAADLAGVITALGLHKPLLLGHSMGAITALALAGSYPNLPRAILLEDPPAWWALGNEMGAGATERMVELQNWLRAVKAKSRAELLAEVEASGPRWSQEEREPWVDSKQRFSPKIAEVAEPKIPVSLDWPAMIGRVNCPALLLTADPALGAACSPEDAAALKAMLPQLQIAHIAGAGHSIRRDQFGPFMAAVQGFLAQQ